MVINNEYLSDIELVIKSNSQLRELRGSSILITGATGLIGSSIADLLFVLNGKYNAGIEILLAGRNKDKIDRRFSAHYKEYKYVEHDLIKYINMPKKVDYIIHCAGICSPQKYKDMPVETLYSNVEGLRIILDEARINHAMRILYVSSSEVYGSREDNNPIRECDYGKIDLLNPRSCYPSGKRAAETLCISYIEEYGLDIVIVRPGHIYGPVMSSEDDRAASFFIKSALRGKTLRMKSDGLQLRSYCYSLDCASAILTVLCKGQKGEAYNISNSKSVITLKEFVEHVQQITKIDVEYVSPSYKEKKAFNLMENSSLNSDLLEMLGWKGMFDARKGIEKAIKYCSDLNN